MNLTLKSKKDVVLKGGGGGGRGGEEEKKRQKRCWGEENKSPSEINQVVEICVKVSIFVYFL